MPNQKCLAVATRKQLLSKQLLFQALKIFGKRFNSEVEPWSRSHREQNLYRPWHLGIDLVSLERVNQILQHWPTLPRFIWKCIQSNTPRERNGHRGKGPDAEKSSLSKLPPAKPFEVQEVCIDVQGQPDEKLKAKVCTTWLHKVWLTGVFICAVNSGGLREWDWGDEQS